MPVAKHRRKKPGRAGAGVTVNRAKLSVGRTWSASDALEKLQSGAVEPALDDAVVRIKESPDDLEALHIAGVAATRLGRLADAIDLLKRAHQVKPADTAVLVNLGRAQSQAGDLLGARESYRAATQLDPNDANAFFNLGNIFSRQEAFYAALEAYQTAIRLSPAKRADIFNNYGYALASVSRHTDAIKAYQEAIAVDPGFADAHNNLGVSQVFVREAIPALQSFQLAGRLGVRVSDSMVNRAGALFELDQLSEALECTDRALALDSSDAEAWRIRGICLAGLGRAGEALEALNQAVDCDPTSGDAKFSRAIHRLRLGDYVGGWHDYESRWTSSFLRRSRRSFPQPQWDGSATLSGKTLLLHAEQGFGDTLQFIRFASRFKALGPQVILEAQPALVSVLSRTELGIDRVIPRGGPLPMFDFHLPLMSCPHVLGISLQSLAVPLPYLRVCADKARQWRARLGEVGGPLIGLVCSGSRTHREDRHRSIPLEELFSALPIGPRYVLLQADIRSDDRRLLSQRADVLNFADKLTDFDETAALCSLMTQIVSVDTSVAHLAGAMGLPVKLLLPFNADFRWLMKRDDSPWYPTMKLYRQPIMGKWADALAALREDLTQQLSSSDRSVKSEYDICEV